MGGKLIWYVVFTVVMNSQSQKAYIQSHILIATQSMLCALHNIGCIYRVFQEE